MPTYYKPGERKGCQFFIVRGWIDGDQYEIRTKAIHKKGPGGAEEAWDDWKREVRAQRSPIPTRETATFDDAVAGYKENKDLSVSEGRYIRLLGAHFEGALLSSIRLGDLHQAAHALYPGCKPQTKNRQAIRPAGAVLHHAAKKGLCDWMLVENLKETDPRRPLMYPEEMGVLIEAAGDDKELGALLITFQRQGWRVTETLKIERARIDWRRKSVERWVSKSKKWRKAAVDADVVALWKTLGKNKDGRLFAYKDRSEVYRAIDALKTGIHFRPHMARRGFATALKDEGADLDDIMRAGGWEDPKSVAVYVRDDIERNRHTIGKIGARLGAKRKSRRKISA